ncbi:MAG TPA: hypothetical protein VFK89_06915 [Actinomycetota bacterium]|nr:hypothetical protein [Actinomycetota bacterium]
MTRTAYLRVYQPLGSFPPEERQHWLRQAEAAEAGGHISPNRWLRYAALPEGRLLQTVSGGAFSRRVGRELLVCPWRTDLRMLAGMVAFRNSLPDEVADAFVPEQVAIRAARELEALGEQHPEVRSHIVHANWHVPLRWFAAFEDADRILTEDKDGLRIRYETPLDEATARLRHALETLEDSWIDDAVIAAVRELMEWLSDFGDRGLVELDYSSVAGMFSDEELVEDHSAAEVVACLQALEAEDVVRAGRIFGALTDRWTAVRAKEVVN